jgi:predicted phage terminase large subunit-like protein
LYSEVDHALATSSPAGFAHVTSGGRWIPYEHLILLNDYLLRVAAGECPRLIVTMPPRHGKSELISKYFPAWYLGRFPDRQLILASYEATFAAEWGGKARDLLNEEGAPLFGVRISGGSSAKDLWRVEDREGVMVTAGLDGGITGKGAHLAIVDDPVKNAVEAQSEATQRKQWNWWVSTLRSRLMPATRVSPGGAVVLVMTRWHQKDLAGQLLADEAGDDWEVLNLPAIAEEGDQLGRPSGAALCPELFDEDYHEATRRASGSYWFAAMYQQRPAPAEGMLHKREHFRYFSVAPNQDGQPFVTLHQLEGSSKSFDVGKCVKAQFCDIAASEKQSADYTVVTTVLRTPDGDMLLWDVKRRRFDLLKVPEFIEGAWREHDKPVLWVEKFGHGHGVVSTLRSKGIPVHELTPVSDKVTRAMPSVAHYEAGKVYHRQGAGWLGDLEDELLAFPNGANDDMVDTVSYAGSKLDSFGGSVKPRVVRVQHKANKIPW